MSAAAVAALLGGSRTSSVSFLRRVKAMRPSRYDYGERHGFSRAWLPTLVSCMRAWSAGRAVAYSDLLPREIKINRHARAIKTKEELHEFLRSLKVPVRDKRKYERRYSVAKAPKFEPRFDENERREIAEGIEVVRALIEPIEASMLQRRLSSACLDAFIATWTGRLRPGAHWHSESAADLLTRTIGMGFLELLLLHIDDVTTSQAKSIVAGLAANRFSIHQKIDVLSKLAERSGLHDVLGRFAQHIAEEIRKDNSIEQRGGAYEDLASAVVAMSVEEAKEYYRQGLAELDQMGGDDYDLIYAVLHFAAEQPGGYVRPELGQRLMNLCQTICHSEPSKFGWALFARAMSKSVGFSAAYKLLRWDDQDVAEFSYGLPQLVCCLAGRAARPETCCRTALGLRGSRMARVADRRRTFGAAKRGCSIGASENFRVVFAKLKAEHSSGGWPSVWESLLKVGEEFPGAVTEAQNAELRALLDAATKAYRRTQ